MELAEIIDLLKQKLEDLHEDKTVKKFYGGTFRAWAQSVETILIRGLGISGMRLINQWRAATGYLPLPRSLVDPGRVEGRWEFLFKSKLPEVEATLQEIISELETFGLPDAYLESQASGVMPKVFIAHGGRSAARDKVERFLDVLGVTPIIVEKRPSGGRSVNENVEWYLNQCDCAVILATKGDIDSKTKEFIPRGNILIEVGRCLEKFPEKTVYLLEEGATFPSDIIEKVWEPFTDDNMENAFIKVANELRAFGLIKAVKS